MISRKFDKFGIVKSICFNLDRRNPTQTMRLFLKKFIEIHKRQQIELLSGQNETSIQKRKLISSDNSKLFYYIRM